MGGVLGIAILCAVVVVGVVLVGFKNIYSFWSRRKREAEGDEAVRNAEQAINEMQVDVDTEAGDGAWEGPVPEGIAVETGHEDIPMGKVIRNSQDSHELATIVDPLEV